jgi:putative peptide zinc metalloprotease protein
MILLPVADAVLLKNDDELYADRPEFDYILLVPSRHRYLSMGSFEARIWKMIEQGITPVQVVANLSAETGNFEQARVDEILHKWWAEGVIAQMGATSEAKKFHWWQRPWWIEIIIPDINQYLAGIYTFVGKRLFNKWGLALQAVVITLGTLAWSALNNVQTIRSLQVQHFPFLWLLGGSLISLFIHELGHGLAMQWAGSKAYRGGVALYLGMPIFFVDTTPVWAKSKRKRIIVSLAGILMNLMQASLLAIAIWLSSAGPGAAVMYQLVIVNIFTAAFSLLPFVRMDGYYILMDILNVPNLENSAWNVAKQLVKGEFPHTPKQRMLIFFAVLNIVFSIVLMLYAVMYWVSLAQNLL